MSVYYNEYDKKTAAWLRELIKQGHLPQGDVDERSIVDVQPGDLAGYAQCHFFAGIGGWAYALQLAGWPTDEPVWTGSCPCQPFSVAGKGLGTKDERHLWPEMFRLIRECRPATVFGEQVASKAGREWLSGVFTDLEGVGYAAAGADLCAASVGAPHARQRLFWVADNNNARRPRTGSGLHGAQWATEQFMCSGADVGLSNSQRRPAERHGHELASTPSCMQGEAREREWFRYDAGDVLLAGGLGHNLDTGPQRHGRPGWKSIPAGRQGAERHSATSSAWGDFDILPFRDGKQRRVESGTFPVAHGIPARVVRLRGYGNAIVPQLAAEFILAATEGGL